MKLTPPKRITFWIAVAIAIVSIILYILSAVGAIQVAALVPVAFVLLVVAFVLLALGLLLKGL